jgi:hypothetical protein
MKPARSWRRRWLRPPCGLMAPAPPSAAAANRASRAGGTQPTEADLSASLDETLFSGGKPNVRLLSGAAP